jgi:hypothetical protein
VPGAAPTATATATSSGFNPSVSLILSGQYARTSLDPANYAITGIPLPVGGDVGPGTRGFSLSETELGLAAQHRSLVPRLRQLRALPATTRSRSRRRTCRRPRSATASG